MADPDLLAKGGRGKPDFLFITHPACFSSFCNSLFFLTQNEGDCAPQVPPLDLPLYIIEQFFPYWFFSFFFFLHPAYTRYVDHIIPAHFPYSTHPTADPGRTMQKGTGVQVQVL